MKNAKPPDTFAAFILTNGRPDRVLTYDTLRKSGYTGRIIVLVDDLDPTKGRYLDRYGDQVAIFDKKKAAASFDNGDNFRDMRAIVYARNASFEVAKKLGLKYFVQLDDDYRSFQYRFDESLVYGYRLVQNLDRVFSALLAFFVRSRASSIAMAQGGDFIGGSSNKVTAQSLVLLRKCMNSFFCSTDRPFQFVGRVNEDVNTYTRQASVGHLFLTTNQVLLCQLQTQSNPGGMTEMYLDGGTYLKSFYTVMYQPSSVKIGIIRGQSASRLHHSVTWRNTTPMILRESIRKAA